MSKDFRHSIDLPAPPERVVELLTDEGSVRARYEAAQFSHVEVITTVSEGAVTVCTKRNETGQLPSPIKKLAGGAILLTQTDEWGAAADDGSRSATWSVRTRGVPVTIDGTIEVTRSATGSTLTQSATVTAKVPVIGNKVEQLSIDQTTGKLDVEWAWVKRNL